jgi:Helix-turn-helix domain
LNALREPPALPPPPVPSALVSAKEAARLLPSHVPGKRISLKTIYNWIFSGRLPAVKRGKFWFVNPDDLFALNVPTLPTQIQPAAKIPDETAASLIKKGIYAVTPEERARLERKGLLEKVQPKGGKNGR